VQREVTVAVWLSVLVATGCKDNPWTPMGSADVVLSEIKLGGAATVARRIDANESFGRTVANGIASGDSAWLEVAGKIAPASSAAEATLSIALATALPRSPAKVLRLVGEKYPVEEVCGIPFLKADSPSVTAYHDQVETALLRVRDSALTAVTSRCRIALDGARDRRLERISPDYVTKNKPAPARGR
jgi:hypothetical protein